MTRQQQSLWYGMGAFVIVLAALIPLMIIMLDIPFDYTLQTVMLGAGVLGIISGVLGSFAVLRKQSLLGDTLAHAALPGVAIAFLFAGRELVWLLIGAGIAGWLATMFILAVLRTTRIKQDTAMGISLTVMFGFGVALLGYIQGREDASRAGLKTFIFGQAAAIDRADVMVISIVTLTVIGIIVFFWKEFKLITFDSEFARTNGYPVQFLDVTLSTLIVVAIVLGLQLAGVILMVGLLIAPAVAARQWTTSLGHMVLLAALFGAFSGVGGTLISAAEAGLPTGPLIIVIALMVVLVSIMLAPGRGLLWQSWQARQDRRRFAAEQLLLDMYDLARRHNDNLYQVPEGMLVGLRGKIAGYGLQQLKVGGLVVDNNNCWSLTEAGLAKARGTTRNRDLWEVYRLHRESLDLPLISEDRTKPIDAILPPSIISTLEDMIDANR